MSQNTTEKMHQMRLRHQGNDYAQENAARAATHGGAWPADSGAGVREVR